MKQKDGPQSGALIYRIGLLDGGYDFLCHLRLIHCINVDTIRMMRFQIQNLTDGIINAGLSHIRRIITIGGNDIRQLFGNG